MHSPADRTNLTVEHLRDLICLQSSLGGLRQETEADETGCAEIRSYIDKLLARTDRRVVEAAGDVDDLSGLFADDAFLDDLIPLGTLGR